MPRAGRAPLQKCFGQFIVLVQAKSFHRGSTGVDAPEVDGQAKSRHRAVKRPLPSRGTGAGRSGASGVHAGYLKPSITVMDLTIFTHRPGRLS